MNGAERTEGWLRATVCELLDRMSDDLDMCTARHIPAPTSRRNTNHMSRNSLKHRPPPEKLRRILKRVLEVVEHRLLLDRLPDLPPRVQAERVRLEMHALAICVDLRLHVSLVGLPDELCQPGPVVLCCVQNLRGGLRVLCAGIQSGKHKNE